jgi:hypothetical protein
MLGVSVRLTQNLEFVIIETASINPRVSMLIPTGDIGAISQLLTEAAESARLMADYDQAKRRAKRKARAAA